MTSHMFQDENVADQYCSVSDHTLLLFSASEAFSTILSSCIHRHLGICVL